MSLRSAARVLLASTLGLGALAVPPATTSGCAALVAALPTVSAVVSDAIAVVGMIESAVTAYFAAHPGTSAVQTTITAAIAKTKAALVTGEQALAGVEQASQAQMAGAFADFSTAFGDLMALVAPLGIVPAQPVVTTVLPIVSDGGVTKAAPIQPGATVIPMPLAVRIVRSAR